MNNGCSVPFQLFCECLSSAREENHHKKKITQYGAHTLRRNMLLCLTTRNQRWTGGGYKERQKNDSLISPWYKLLFHTPTVVVPLTKLFVFLVISQSLLPGPHSCLSVHCSRAVMSFPRQQVRTNLFRQVEILKKVSQPGTNSHSPILDPVALFFCHCFSPLSHHCLFIFPSSSFFVPFPGYKLQ